MQYKDNKIKRKGASGKICSYHERSDAEMKTEVVKITDPHWDEKVKHLGEIIRNGGLVAFPTETVYGLETGWIRKPLKRYIHPKAALRITR